MKIEKDKMVSIHYTLKDIEGNQLDSSVGSTPLDYVHGYGNLIVGLEKELEDKNVGDKLHVQIEPKDAYGEFDSKLIMDVPRDRFDTEEEIAVGMPFQVMTPQGPIIVRVTEVSKDNVKIDGNHELAGKELVFDVEVVNVRDATEEEISPSGCGCGGGCGNCEDGCSSEDGCGCSGDCGCN